ncbi:hypothetical protein EW145_g8352, partial [Phellinidium pouzarii]
STPGLPLTPASSDDGFALPTIAPLSISKSNRTSSPAHSSSPSPPPRSPLRGFLNNRGTSSSPIPTPVQTQTQTQAAPKSSPKSKTGSRSRFSARTSTTTSVARVFAPLDTVAANTLDLSLGFGCGCTEDGGAGLTLTGVLEEVAREAEYNRRVREADEAWAECAAARKEAEDRGEDDDKSWVDVEAEDEEGRDYYRSDIATHLQLFSFSSFAGTASTNSALTRHKRVGSSSSYLQQQQFPPARPDSLPPPPHASTLPPLSSPASPNGHAYSRRASASSLASTASGRSTRSTSSQHKLKAKTKARTSRARISAAQGVGRRRSSMKARTGKPLPATPTSANVHTEIVVKGPSPLLDPTFPAAPAEESTSALPGAEREATRATRRPPVPVRPPPRFSLPVDVDFGADDDLDMDLFGAVGMMGELKEEVDEDGDEQGLRFCDIYMGNMGGEHEDEHEEHEDENVVDPFAFAFPSCLARGDVPLTSTPGSSNPPTARAPVTLSVVPHNIGVPAQTPGPFLLAPSSPTASSSYSNSTSGAGANDHDHIDAESLFSHDGAPSVYADGAGRILRSRWSVSTFASSTNPPADLRIPLLQRLEQIVLPQTPALLATRRASAGRAREAAAAAREREGEAGGGAPVSVLPDADAAEPEDEEQPRAREVCP